MTAPKGEHWLQQAALQGTSPATAVQQVGRANSACSGGQQAGEQQHPPAGRRHPWGGLAEQKTAAGWGPGAAVSPGRRQEQPRALRDLRHGQIAAGSRYPALVLALTLRP